MRPQPLGCGHCDRDSIEERTPRPLPYFAAWKFPSRWNGARTALPRRYSFSLMIWPGNHRHAHRLRVRATDRIASGAPARSGIARRRSRPRRCQRRARAHRGVHAGGPSRRRTPGHDGVSGPGDGRRTGPTACASRLAGRHRGCPGGPCRRRLRFRAPRTERGRPHLLRSRGSAATVSFRAGTGPSCDRASSARGPGHASGHRGQQGSRPRGQPRPRHRHRARRRRSRVPGATTGWDGPHRR